MSGGMTVIVSKHSCIFRRPVRLCVFPYITVGCLSAYGQYITMCDHSCTQHSQKVLVFFFLGGGGLFYANLYRYQCNYQVHKLCSCMKYCRVYITNTMLKILTLRGSVFLCFAILRSHFKVNKTNCMNFPEHSRRFQKLCVEMVRLRIG